MTDVPSLEAYDWDEYDYETFDDLDEQFEHEVPERFNIADYACDRWAADRKNHVALYEESLDGDSSAYSFQQISKLSNQLAHGLRERGVERGDRIAFNGSQRVEPIVLSMATFKLGAVAVPLSVLLGPDGLRYRLDDCSTTVFLADEGAIDTIREIRDDLDDLDHVLTMGAYDGADEENVWDVLEGQPRRFDNVDTDAEDDACIVYTSGTTGQPKGALHAHRHLLGVLTTTAFGNQDESSVAYTVVEWSWIASFNGLVLVNMFYGRPVLGYDREEFEPETAFDLIEKYGVTRFSTSTTGLRMMMQVDDPGERWDLSSVRKTVAGGEHVGHSIAEWLYDTFPNTEFSVGYGQTEAPALVTDKPEIGLRHKFEYLGTPNLGHEFAVLDPETLEPVEQGEVGELAVRYEGDPMLMKEYWNKPGKTDEKIREGWLLTEDLVKEDEDGYLKFQTRKDDVIISSGYRIGPAEIEESLATHGAVLKAGVIGVPHETRGEIPKAFVRLADGHEPSDSLNEELQSHVKENLAKYEYPREIEFVEELPLTSTDKVQRHKLKQWEGVADE